jgi:hypothetical protein
MAINVLTNNYVSPENLFVEGYKSGNYWGEGFSHEGLSMKIQEYEMIQTN